MSSRCIRWERIANEILMHFRAQRKLQGEVSLSDTIETGPEGDALYLSDVVGEEDTMLEELQDKENRKLIRRDTSSSTSPASVPRISISVISFPSLSVPTGS